MIQAGGRPALSHFNNEQTTPPPHKSVSFSAPTTPRQQSAASSPGYGIPIDYEFPATLQGYDHNGSNRVQTAKKTMPYRQTQQRNSAYMNPAFLRNDRKLYIFLIYFLYFLNLNLIFIFLRTVKLGIAY